ncbi:RNA-directed DNA polymerase from mobile element jockey [Plakobranchus ocellatus]|uniref:RNA-directed DNA polymerase from mobile element jockey n=1 Tax=Plakobranchus ocellatus TaxID=259542 RepID=A0AAV4A1L8_9GAST|nr:RNA-directed DNA polymerase from mobile element jockey [Plakobranchus ocellatus]
MLEEFTAENDLIILNSGEQTFVHSTSAINLAVASPSIAAEYSWAAQSDLCGSDHFPIFLNFTSNFSNNVNATSFNFKKADWNRFRDLCKLSLDDSVADIEQFTSKLLDAARSSIPFHKGTKNKTRVPWFTQFLRHLPESCLHTLLKLFNNIWTTWDIPPSWREASVVPIPKPGKDPSDPSNYRPIALTSCLCKTLERGVNDRLVHVLESRNLLSNVQCGFRKDHSTLDHLFRLETFTKKAFARKKQVLAFFFDQEKAYDTTWRYGILKDLFDLDFRGRLPIFISNFLKDRHFKVKAENTFSSSYHQENGVPQGSILSPMLFNLKINNIIKSVSKHVNASLFVDDFPIYAEGKHLQHLERTIHLYINNVQKWVSENGFRFSVSKTTCVHFHRQRIYTEPALHLDGQPIPVKGEAKFLGVVFDSKLTFYNYVQYLKKKCLKVLNLLRVVGHTDWGADRATLLKLYRTLVRSNEAAYQKEFFRIKEKFSNHYAVFTDGSKLEEKVAAAAYFSENPDRSKATRLRDGASVFSAELEGIALALTEIKKLTKYHKNFVIYNDSLSALQAIQSKNFKVIDIRRLYNLIRKFPTYVHISFVWIPAHVGIQGNENVDKLTKGALNRTSTSGKLICYSDLKPKINTYIKSVWQRDWDAEGANKLHEVLPNLGEDLHRRGEGAGRKL